ncbi:MAG: PilT/PilU family type 4a pilus ATPase [Thermodesulfobacteriota bacterium]|nr:PilT/PilU family type 4a pilus ATPase [Thermodesulfobacteriota bacterium]
MRQAEVNRILDTMLQEYDNLSDLNFTVGRPLQVESAGELVPVPIDPPIENLTPFQTEIFSLNLVDMDKRLTHSLVNEGYCDLSYHLPGKARFRVNIFSQRGHYSIVMRKLENKIPTINALGLPECFHKIANEKNGLALVTGATGSGKTTSLAAILNVINETKAIHMITLEDPVEYLHTHKKATINQRELGKDFDSFANGLRAALRQAPKVILVGEMRDRETMEIGLSAAETGHLVFATLHTIDAGQTINRIIGMFDKEEENQVRFRLADTLKWIVSQRLLPKIGGGRAAIFEILSSNIRVKESIIHGEQEGKTFYDIISGGDTYDMQTFDKDIISNYESGIITADTSLAYASRKAVVGRGIDQIKFAKGEKTTDIEGLDMDDEYGKVKSN